MKANSASSSVVNGQTCKSRLVELTVCESLQTMTVDSADGQSKLESRSIPSAEACDSTEKLISNEWFTLPAPSTKCCVKFA